MWKKRRKEEKKSYYINCVTEGDLAMCATTNNRNIFYFAKPKTMKKERERKNLSPGTSNTTDIHSRDKRNRIQKRMEKK